MAGCKLTNNITSDACEYAVAGVVAFYVANYYTPNDVVTLPEDPIDGVISYTKNVDGEITGMQLPEGESLFKVDVAAETGNFADQLLAGGNGTKYRQHQIGGIIPIIDKEMLNANVDAISLGRFIVIVETATGFYLLGRRVGLTAPANGMDYGSGTAAADGSGWTLLLQGASTETMRKVEGTVIAGLLAPADDEGPEEVVG